MARHCAPHSTKDGSVSFLPVIFLIVVLALAAASTKFVCPDLAVSCWTFLIATFLGAIFCSFGSENTDAFVVRVVLASDDISTHTEVGIDFYDSLFFFDIFSCLVLGLFRTVRFIYPQFGCLIASCALRFVRM
jgi:hypothetical protein